MGLLLGVLTMILAHFVWARRATSVKAEPKSAIHDEPSE